MLSNSGVLLREASGLNFGSRSLDCSCAAVDLFCFPAVAFFLGFEGVGLLAAPRMIEDNGSGLLVLSVSTVPGVFGEIWPSISKGTRFLSILFLTDRLGDVDRDLDRRNEGSLKRIAVLE